MGSGEVAEVDLKGCLGVWFWLAMIEELKQRGAKGKRMERGWMLGIEPSRTNGDVDALLDLQDSSS